MLNKSKVLSLPAEEGSAVDTLIASIMELYPELKLKSKKADGVR